MQRIQERNWVNGVNVIKDWFQRNENQILLQDEWTLERVIRNLEDNLLIRVKWWWLFQCILHER
jgi:hypothetical protein